MSKKKTKKVVQYQSTEILDPLNYIQCHLNAPKNQRNTFGNYNYRNCEDILEALKPLLLETGCSLIISDDVIEIGGRVYICAVSKLMRGNTLVAESKAFAREPHTVKGMSEPQITGSSSSYARKYSLNGLFSIDDNKDPDTNELREQKKNAPVQEPKQPRVPHEDHIKTVLDSMDRAESKERMKLIAREAYAYFKDWNATEQMQIVQNHVATLEGNIVA